MKSRIKTSASGRAWQGSRTGFMVHTRECLSYVETKLLKGRPLLERKKSGLPVVIGSLSAEPGETTVNSDKDGAGENGRRDLLLEAYIKVEHPS